MTKNSIATGLLLVIFTMTGLYAQAQTPQVKPILTEKAVKGFIKNHNKLLEELNTFQYDENSTEAQWFEAFRDALEEATHQAAAFLKKNPAPKKLQALFRKYGLDGKTGLLQIMVIVYTALSIEYGDSDIPFNIHPDDLKLVQKYRAEVSELLKPIPIETENNSK